MKILQQEQMREASDDVIQSVELSVQGLSLALSGKPILKAISCQLFHTGITSLIGPSGAGKSSLLRCLNMLYDDWQGEITIAGKSIRAWQGGVDALRQHVGLIAQKPAVFPVSIYENVIFGMPKKVRKQNQDAWVAQCLKQAALWDEVKARLDEPASALSIGQQQRLCLARALALKPKILLLDEPTASLDPRSKQLIEASLHQLSASITVLCVTHDLEQAQRLQGQVIFMCDGKVIESGDADAFFQHPERVETREFLRWSVCDCD